MDLHSAQPICVNVGTRNPVSVPDLQEILVLERKEMSSLGGGGGGV